MIEIHRWMQLEPPSDIEFVARTHYRTRAPQPRDTRMIFAHRANKINSERASRPIHLQLAFNRVPFIHPSSKIVLNPRISAPLLFPSRG